MKTLFYLFCVFLSLQMTFAQEVPLNGQIFINPYYYNPAFAGFEDRSAFYVYRRQQWTGISGAPVTTGFNFHTIFNNKVTFGTHIFNDERGILNTTKGMITLGYRVSFDNSHYISFAITGGVGSNTIDMDAVDMDDPAILNALNSSLFLDGNAGFNYHNHGFNLGLSLPKLFKSNTLSYSSFSPGEISPLNDAILMSSYRWEIMEDKFALEPHLIYYYNKELPGQYEVLGRLHFNNIFWVGASYRKDFGVAAFAGLNIRDNFKFGYAYELSTAQSGTFGYSTHDIQLALMIGKKKNKSKVNLMKKRRNMMRATGRMPQQRKQKTQTAKKKTFDTQPSQVTEFKPVQVTEYNEEEALKDFLEGMEKDAVSEQNVVNNLLVPPVLKDTVNIFNFEFDEELFDQSEQLNQKQKDTDPRFRKAQKSFNQNKSRLSKKIKEFKFEEISTLPDTTLNKSNEALNEFIESSNARSIDENLDAILDELGVYIGPKTVSQGNHMLELEKGNYVIVGAFGSYLESEEYSDQLFLHGIKSKFGFISQTKIYYVYVFMSKDLRESKTMSNRLKKMKIDFKENWVLQVQ